MGIHALSSTTAPQNHQALNSENAALTALINSQLNDTSDGGHSKLTGCNESFENKNIAIWPQNAEIQSPKKSMA